jgi:hypothetical protein
MIELPATTLLAKNAAYVHLRLACPASLFDSLVRLFRGDSSHALRELSSVGRPRSSGSKSILTTAPCASS